MKKVITLICLLVSTLALKAQTDIKFTINHQLNGKAFSLGMEGTNNIGNEMKFSRLEYYISAINLIHDGAKESDASDVYILVNGKSMDTVDLGSYDITKLEAIEFSVGVDPSVNNADPTKWPKDHALSPKSPSMHWGWSSGYRFAAIEGNSGSNFSQKFEVHALGNDNFFKIRIPTDAVDIDGGKLITLNAEYSAALRSINVSSGLIYHGSDNQGVTLLKNFKNHVFTSTSGAGNELASVKGATLAQVDVYPNPSSGNVTVNLSGTTLKIKGIQIVGMDGKELDNIDVSGVQNHQVTLSTPGIYAIRVECDNGAILTRRVIVR